ncbi:MAG TPA: OmpH family outer membrane protein [Pyrinomonadaceae bacterium]|nr:OmpH family outer membrane protein [Pyrinomonadaceae bacterium]
MKIIRMFAASAIFAAIVALPAFAQGTRPTGTTTPPPRPTATPAANPGGIAVPEAKIAFVNTEAFADEKEGINRFVSALQTLQREFKPKQDELQGIQNRMRQIATDIENLQKAPVVSQTSIQTKQDDGEKLQREYEYKEKDYTALSQRRYREVVGPVSADIGKELDSFRKDHGITMILDVTKLLPAILSARDEMDITRMFITYYNAKNPATAAAQPAK